MYYVVRYKSMKMGELEKMSKKGLNWIKFKVQGLKYNNIKFGQKKKTKDWNEDAEVLGVNWTREEDKRLKKNEEKPKRSEEEVLGPNCKFGPQFLAKAKNLLSFSHFGMFCNDIFSIFKGHRVVQNISNIILPLNWGV